MVYLNVIELNMEIPKTHSQLETFWNWTNFIFVTKFQFNSYQVPYPFFPLVLPFLQDFSFSSSFTHLAHTSPLLLTHLLPKDVKVFLGQWTLKGIHCFAFLLIKCLIPSNELMKIGNDQSFSPSSKDHSRPSSWSTSLELDKNAYD